MRRPSHPCPAKQCSHRFPIRCPPYRSARLSIRLDAVPASYNHRTHSLQQPGVSRTRARYMLRRADRLKPRLARAQPERHRYLTIRYQGKPAMASIKGVWSLFGGHVRPAASQRIARHPNSILWRPFAHASCVNPAEAAPEWRHFTCPRPNTNRRLSRRRRKRPRREINRCAFHSPIWPSPAIPKLGWEHQCLS